MMNEPFDSCTNVSKTIVMYCTVVWEQEEPYYKVLQELHCFFYFFLEEERPRPK